MTTILLGDDTVDVGTNGPLPVAAVTAGNDGAVAQRQDYVDALHWLDKIADVSLIAVPGVGSAFVADGGRAAKMRAAISNSFGFGGQNGVLVFTRF